MADTLEEIKKREENRNKRLKSLEEAIRKLTDTEDKSVKFAEKRLKEISRTKKQLEGFEDLGSKLKDSLLAPLQGLASSIPAPLRILGKMALKPFVTPFLKAKEASLGGGAAPAGAGPVRHEAFSEAMGREMSQKGYYKGMTAATLAKIPGMGSLAKSWEGKGGIKAKLSGWMGMTTEEGGPGGTNLPKRFLAFGTAFYKAGLTKKRGIWVRIVGLDPSAKRENALEAGAGGTAMVPAAGKGLATKVKFPFLRFLGLQALFNTIWPWIARLGLPAAALLILKPLGIGALGGAVIIWGLWAAYQSILDLITGWKEGGITGAIETFLTGDDGAGGIFNAVKNAAKLGGLFAAAGFLAGGPPGLLAGALIGLAMGGILGYFGSDKLNEWQTNIKTAVSKMFSWENAPDWLKGATFLGGATLFGLLALVAGGTAVAWPVALAVLLGGMAIGGLSVVAKNIMDSPMDKVARGLRDEAFEAQNNWAERHLWSWMRRAVGLVTGEETTPEQKKMQALWDKRAKLIQDRNNQLVRNEDMLAKNTGGGAVNQEMEAWMRTQPGFADAPSSIMTHGVHGALLLASIKKQLEEVSAQISGEAVTPSATVEPVTPAATTVPTSAVLGISETPSVAEAGTFKAGEIARIEAKGDAMTHAEEHQVDILEKQRGYETRGRGAGTATDPDSEFRMTGKLATLEAPGLGLQYQVAEKLAPNFGGLLEGLSSLGYKAEDLIGYRQTKMKSGEGSMHAWGAAIDLNRLKNLQSSRLQSDLPGVWKEAPQGGVTLTEARDGDKLYPDGKYGTLLDQFTKDDKPAPGTITGMAAGYGLGWGGNFGTPDTMHFTGMGGSGSGYLKGLKSTRPDAKAGQAPFEEVKAGAIRKVIELPGGGVIVDGKLHLDESAQAWRDWMSGPRDAAALKAAKAAGIKGMAKGGSLSGAAIVGEAGPELVIGNAEVIPLRFLQQGTDDGTLGWWDTIKAFFGFGPKRTTTLAEDRARAAKVRLPFGAEKAKGQVITQRDKQLAAINQFRKEMGLPPLDSLAKGGTIGEGFKKTAHGFMAKDYAGSGLGGLMNAGKSMLGGGSGSLSMTGSSDLGDGVSGSAGFSVTGGGSGSSVGISGDFDRPRLTTSQALSSGWGGDINNNSMANVSTSTTNISQPTTRDVGMALRPALPKRSLGIHSI